MCDKDHMSELRIKKLQVKVILTVIKSVTNKAQKKNNLLIALTTSL